MGDRVNVFYPENGDPVIDAVNSRKNKLKRPSVANVDKAVAVMSVCEPPLDLALLDRMIVSAAAEDLDVIICLNKIDLASAEKLDNVQKVNNVYQDCSYKVILSSALSGQGVGDLQRSLKGSVAVLAGPSGAGKSTIINQLVPGVKLRTAPVSKKSKKGRHTTRYVELIPWNQEGYIVDTPGFQRMDMEGIPSRDLQCYFPDIAQYAEDCRFGSCVHEAEPDCSVKAALQDNKIAPWRYEHYLFFLKELKHKEKQY